VTSIPVLGPVVTACPKKYSIVTKFVNSWMKRILQPQRLAQGPFFLLSLPR
jgi:hypothetical protein